MPLPSLPLRYWNPISNLGDAITPHIVRQQFEVEPYFADKAKPHVLAIGSVFHLATPTTTIWGSGVLDPRNLGDVRPARITAVRGKLTFEALKNKGLSLGDIPLGDPGIFAVDLLGPADPRAEKIGVIPHHSSIENPIYDAVRADPQYELISFRDNTLAPLEQIRRCTRIISESLHGLIFAEAFGIPSVWISTKTTSGWTFKYEDWHSTCANPQARPLVGDDLRALGWSAVAERAERRECHINRQDLLDAFPRELVGPPREGMVGFEACRARAPVQILVAAAEPPTAAAEIPKTADLKAVLGAGFAAAEAAIGAQFRHWAERPYHVVQFGPGEGLDAVQLERAVAFMDRYRDFDAAFLHPASRRGDAGPAAAAGSPWLMIRPSRFIGRLKKIGAAEV